jgi:hypothetical protein
VRHLLAMCRDDARDLVGVEHLAPLLGTALAEESERLHGPLAIALGLLLLLGLVERG